MSYLDYRECFDNNRSYAFWRQVGACIVLLITSFTVELYPLFAFADDACIRSAEIVKKAVELGEGSEAEIALYKEAQALCPKMTEAHFNLGLAYQKKGDLDAAEKELRESVRLKDEEPFRLGLSGVLLQKGEVTAAREQYEVILEKNPRSVSALQGIAVILEKQRKVNEAV